MYTFLTVDLIITSITYKDVVDFGEEAAIKENRVAIMDIVTTRITVTGIVISSKIKSIGFVIRLAVG
jgi:hypothetical protein